MKLHWRIGHLGRRKELQEEIESHLQMAIADRVARGEPEEVARQSAVREFGNVPLVQDVTRETWGWLRLERLCQDFRFATRQMRRAPGFTAIAIITLALGIGANAAIFSLVNAVLLKPLPYPHPERIVSVSEKNPGGGSNPISTLSFLDWERQNRCFEFLSAIAWDTVTLTASGSPEELNVQRVSAS